MERKNNITSDQIKLIHTAKNALNLDDETYRETLQARFRVSSSKDLTYNQANFLIEMFRAKGFKLKPKKKAAIKKGGNVVRIISQAQHELIEILKSNIVWRFDNGYQLWLEKRMRLEKVLTSSDAVKVIEGLKAMIGIKTPIITMKALPFPYRPDPQNFIDPKTGEIIEILWMFDTTQKRLVSYKVNGDSTCLTMK